MDQDNNNSKDNSQGNQDQNQDGQKDQGSQQSQGDNQDQNQDQDNQQGQEGQGEGQSEDILDQSAKDTNDKINSEQTQQNEQELNKDNVKQKSQETQAKQQDTTSSQSLEKRRGEMKSRDIQLDTKFVARFSWKQILKKMLPNDDKKEEETYSKISRNSVAALQQVKDTGSGVAKPGKRVS